MPSLRTRTVLLVVLLLAGLVPRVLSMASPERVAASISEDGYLMLTVARNLADGRGLSTAAGTIPTNGVQPLVTFIWAGVHAITPDDAAALRVVVVIELLTAVAGAFLVGALARHLFGRHPDVETVSRLSAAAWFASPMALRHTTNGLETGIYAAIIAVVLLVDARWRARSFARSVAIGLLLGLAVLVRNDAAVLVAAYCVVRLFWSEDDARAGCDPAPTRDVGAASHAARLRQERATAASPPEPVPQRLAHAIVVGLASVVATSPWLVFNLTHFGHIVPISGRSQSLDTALGENLVKLPRTLVEYLLGGLPLFDAAQVPGPWPVALTAVVVAALAGAWRCRPALGVAADRTWLVLLLFVAGLATYYGAFFAAGHFLSRYLFPASLVTPALLAAALASQGASTASAPGLARRRQAAALGLAVLWAGAAVMADARLAQRAARHPHMHVVEWVRANVTDDEWVAAPQSGTVGYFHDRTINLDGKVNPEALRARDEGRLFRYVVEETEARYIADWYGLSRWLDAPSSVQDERDPGVLGGHFRYAVKDASANLVVLERISRAGM